MSNILTMEKSANQAGDQSAEIKSNPKPARFVISVELEGFPVSIELEARAEQLMAMIERLKALGAVPPASAAQPARAAASEPPRCTVHGKPMKASQKPGSFFCPRRLDDGSYCPEKA